MVLKDDMKLIRETSAEALHGAERDTADDVPGVERRIKHVTTACVPTSAPSRTPRPRVMSKIARAKVT